MRKLALTLAPLLFYSSTLLAHGEGRETTVMSHPDVVQSTTVQKYKMDANFCQRLDLVARHIWKEMNAGDDSSVEGRRYGYFHLPDGERVDYDIALFSWMTYATLETAKKESISGKENSTKQVEYKLRNGTCTCLPTETVGKSPPLLQRGSGKEYCTTTLEALEKL